MRGNYVHLLTNSVGKQITTKANKAQSPHHTHTHTHTHTQTHTHTHTYMSTFTNGFGKAVESKSEEEKLPEIRLAIFPTSN